MRKTHGKKSLKKDLKQKELHGTHFVFDKPTIDESFKEESYQAKGIIRNQRLEGEF